MRKSFTILMLFMLFLSGCYSCQTWNHMIGKGPRSNFPDKEFFWDKGCRPITDAAPSKPAPAKPQQKPAVKNACGSSSVSSSYPCGSCIISKDMPAEVTVNKEFSYTIKVTNPTDLTLNGVVVTENLAENFNLSNTNPQANVEEGKLVFAIGELGPGQTKIITISGTATSADCLESCANVSYVIPICASVNVVQPALKLVKTAPAGVLLCETIPVKFVVTNTGTGSAENVKIQDNLPAGLTTTDGKNVITIDAGTLAAGQSKEFTATLKADKIGKYENKAVAGTPSGLKAEAATVTEVRQPVLAITKTGIAKLYLGRPVEYEITVTNKGNSPARDLVLEDNLPTGAKLVSASDGGKAFGGKVTWNFEMLSPGDSRKVNISVMPDGIGTLTNTAMATAVCAETVKASAKTVVSGIPAVLLEVIDTDDPVELNGQTTYVITATNQGSMPDTNIKIVCTLEENEQYVSSSGATIGSAAGNTITFAPLPSLAPKAQATWRVVIKAVKAGDVRFTTVMNTDQLTRPVQETESTHLYE